MRGPHGLALGRAPGAERGLTGAQDAERSPRRGAPRIGMNDRGPRLLFAAILMALGCARGGSRPADSTAIVAERDIHITLERGTCLGYCPMYRVELHGDGRVVYDGLHFVRDSGRREDTIPAADVRTLATEMAQAGYFGFATVYEPDATDHATVSTSLRIDGRTREVRHNLGSRSAPAVLEALYARIDSVARTAQWIGDPQTGPPLKGRTSEPPPPDDTR